MTSQMSCVDLHQKTTAQYICFHGFPWSRVLNFKGRNWEIIDLYYKILIKCIVTVPLRCTFCICFKHNCKLFLTKIQVPWNKQSPRPRSNSLSTVTGQSIKTYNMLHTIMWCGIPEKHPLTDLFYVGSYHSRTYV